MSTFRHEYRTLTAYEKELVEQIKDAAERVETLYKAVTVPSRALALAMTKLEESVMWAVKGITG